MINLAFLYHSSTAQTHANDVYSLRGLLPKRILFLMMDGGWDQNLKSNLVLFHLGRLFRILDKDVIMQFHYAPGSSAFNFI